jgi:hypothetical protein
MNKQSILDSIQDIHDTAAHDPEAASGKEYDLLYEFVDFVAQTDGYLADWAAMIMNVKDIKFRRF